MSRRSTRVSSAWLIALAGALGLASGCGDSVVGSACVEGFTAEGSACVPVRRPEGRSPAGSGGTAEATGGAGGDASTGSSGGSSGGAETGAGGDASAGSSGGAETGAGGDASTGSSGGAGGSGGGCEEGMAACPPGCVDLSSDPDNCGACGKVCATGICEGGACAGALAGHGVILGMDGSSEAPGSPFAKLLGNAVFLSPREPVRLLDFRRHVEPGAKALSNVSAILASEAKARGRTLAISVPPPGDEPPPLSLGAEDVLLVHHQADAPAGALGTLGAAWAGAIASFTAEGGVVVALASDSGTAEMTDFLGASGLLGVLGLAPVTGQVVENVGWLDALGVGVPSPFLARPSSVAFLTDEPPSAATSFVITSEGGLPVVVHKVFSP